jgi:hypothetical protein
MEGGEMEAYIIEAMAARAARLTERAAAEGKTQRWIDNRLKKRQAELDTIAAAQGVKSVSIGVEWKKSRTWGSNPTASVKVCYADGTCQRYTGTASGCGYDKETAAIAEALNKCPAISRALILHREKLPYGARVNEFSAGFSGGVGISCYYEVFEALGLKFEHVASGKMFDAYLAS